MQTISERFEKNVFPEPNTGCFLWAGNQRKKQGYGGFRLLGKMELAHRVSYALYKGPIKDKHVLHTCDNPNCVNPDHLFIGTHQDNMTDMKNKGRGVSHNGSKHYASKFTENQVKYIKYLLTQGVKQITIALMYRVHKGTIQGIASGKTWKHV